MSGFLSLLGGGTTAQQPSAAGGITVQTSVYGAPIPVVYGTNRVSGNVIWYGAFQAHQQSGQSGGKGGSSGGKGSGGGSFTYTASWAIAVCEGAINGIQAVWASSAFYPNPGLEKIGATVFGGALEQAPWGYLTANFPDQAVGYSGVCYVAAANFNLGSSPVLPNLSFEVLGLLPASTVITPNGAIQPSCVLSDILINPVYGLGWSFNWIGNWTQYANYCGAMGLYISPVLDSQQQAQAFIQDILNATNSNCWWSEGVLKIAPYGDVSVSGNGVSAAPVSFTYTPNITPVYALNDDNYIYSSGQDPVQVTRSSPQDAYNIVNVEVVERVQSYAPALCEAKDYQAVALYGPQPDSGYSYHFITDSATGQVIAQTMLQRDLYIRNSFTFKLGWIFCALEPMDLVSLTDSRLGLTNYVVRITEVSEDSDGTLSITAEDFPAGVASPALYTIQSPLGTLPNFNATAPNAKQVVFYEPPGEVTDNQMVLWMGVGGTGDWGGAQIWVSTDQNTYVNVGEIVGTSRVGFTTSAMSLGTDPDVADILGVDLTNSGGYLNSGTMADADGYVTLCLVGDELISYQNAALTGTSKYNLTYIRRGAYCTNEDSWPIGSQFMRCDNTVFSYPIDSSLIGKQIYVKLASFNSYSGGTQSLADVPIYTYNVVGSGVNQALPDVQGVFSNYVAGLTQIFWSPVVDHRSVDYEIRVGSTWGTSLFVARVTAVSFSVTGNGTFWVAAHFRNPNGFDVYSDNPTDILITNNILIANLIAAWDEVATGWSGTFTGGAVALGSQLTLQGVGNILTAPNVLILPTLVEYGGVSPAGSYEVPASHDINVGYSGNCTVNFNYVVVPTNITDNILDIANILVAPDILDTIATQFITAIPQIAIAPSNGIYGDWQNYQPGTYTGQYFKVRLNLTSSNTNVTPIVLSFKFAVYVNILTINFTNQTIAAGGTTLPYGVTYNAGPNGAALPNVQVSILNASQGDTVVISGKTLSQVTVQIMNGGVGVSRVTDIAVTGF